jgi:hypothetical protein
VCTHPADAPNLVLLVEKVAWSLAKVEKADVLLGS